MAPTLFGLKEHHSSFEVDDAYFDGLPDRVMERIRNQRTVPMWRKNSFRISMGIAAGLALLAAIVSLMKSGVPEETSGQDMIATVEETYTPVVEDLLPTTPVYELDVVDALNDSDETTWLANAEVDTESIETSEDDEQIIAYLVSNDIGIFEIVDELKTVDL